MEYMNADKSMILLGEAVEGVTSGVKIINSDHALHHLGYGYKAYIDFTNLASNGTLSYCFHSAPALYCHVKAIELSVLDSSCKVEILTGANVTVDTGTAVAFNNTNAITTATATSTLKASPTYTGGSVWHRAMILINSTAQNKPTATTGINENDEIVLNKDTNYILKITNIGTSTITRGYLSLFMYEEPKGLI
jgi:hypothetical protein